MPAKAFFLDRDGTVIVHRPYHSDPADVELLRGVRETLPAAVRRTRGSLATSLSVAD